MSPNVEDRLLVDLIAGGSQEAEDILVNRYQARVYRALICLRPDPLLAEDLSQETFILVLQNLRQNKLNQPEKLSSYILSTSRFIFLGWLRRKDNQAEARAEFDEFETDRLSPEKACMEDEERKQVQGLIWNLNVPRDKEILTRCYLHDQSKSEICSAMSLSQAHYDRVISRARGRLRAEVI